MKMMSVIGHKIAPRVYRVVEALYREMNDALPTWDDMTDSWRRHFTDLVTFAVENPQAKALHVAIRANHSTSWENIPARDAAIYHVIVACVPGLWVAEVERVDDEPGTNPRYAEEIGASEDHEDEKISAAEEITEHAGIAREDSDGADSD